MSRFSPTVQSTSGRALALALGQSVNAYLGSRQQKREQDIQDQERQRSEGVQNAQLGEQGIHLLAPGQSAPVAPQADVNQGIAHALNPSAGLPAVEAPAERYTTGQGYYIDRGEQAASAQRSAQAKYAAMLSEALAKGKAEDIVNPGGRVLDQRLKESEINKNNRPPAPTAPVMGSPEWRAAQQYLSGLQGAQHAANRSYDVAHPLPVQQMQKPTEMSAKAALVYPRAQQSAQLLEPFFDKGVPASSVLGKVTFGQYGVSPEIQRANQAAETVSSAILRLESGAAISEHEVKEYAKQFLPQPGDSREVLEQKRATLHTQLERMRQAANPTMSRDAGATTPSGDTGGKTITVNGKTFRLPD